MGNTDGGVDHVALTFHLEADGDTYPATVFEGSNAADCDDQDASTYPGAAFNEPGADASACMTDADGDGWGDSSPGPGVTPGRDCDDGSPGVTNNVYREDCDGDGQGSDTSTARVHACSTPAPSQSPDVGLASCSDQSRGGWVENTNDCLDRDPATRQGAASEDANQTGSLCMTDADGDGHGAEVAPAGASVFWTPGSDCNDGSGDAFPGAEEICDFADNDCNDVVDDVVSEPSCDEILVFGDGFEAGDASAWAPD